MLEVLLEMMLKYANRKEVIGKYIKLKFSQNIILKVLIILRNIIVII